MIESAAGQKGLRRRCHLVLLVLWGLLLALAPPVSGAQTGPHGSGADSHYVLGVFPFIPTASIDGLFAPIAAELSAAIGHPVILRTTDSYEKFMAALSRREYDIAFVQPFDYVEIAKPKGYLPLARRNEELASTIVTRSDSAIGSIGELKGKTLGMPPAVAAVSILNSIALRRAGLDPGKNVTLKHLASHQACLQQLLVGDLDACGVSPAGIRLVEGQMGVRFKEIGRSPAIPHALFVARGSLPPSERKVMKKVLTETYLETVPSDYRSLFLLPGKKPFLPASDRDYDPVRRHLRTVTRR